MRGISTARMGAVVLAWLPTASAAWAHHSYAMFDSSRRQSVAGVVAKFEWQNPHSAIWAYVRDPKAPKAYLRYVFETGATNVLLRHGWSKASVKPGDAVSFEYFPFKDPKMLGGSLITAAHPGGAVLVGDAQGVKILKGIADKPQ